MSPVALRPAGHQGRRRALWTRAARHGSLLGPSRQGGRTVRRHVTDHPRPAAGRARPAGIDPATGRERMRLGSVPARSRSARWLRLYPRDWRERYGDELLEVLEARPIDWRVRFDLVRGALDAHLNPLSPPDIGFAVPLFAGRAWIGPGAA